MTEQQLDPHFGEEHYQLAMEAAAVGLWDWDLQREQLLWNTRCKAIFGLPADEFMTYNYFLSLIHPEDREYVEREVMLVLNTKANLILEYRIVWPDGSVHWISVRGKGIYNVAGQAVRMIGVSVDITIRKQAELMQREAAAEMHTILESLPDGFVLIDQAWHCVYMNPQIEKMRGIPREHLLYQPLWNAYPTIKGSLLEEQARYTMETRQATRLEIYYVEVNQWYEFSIFPSKRGGISIYTRDITEQKFLEEERERLLISEREARIEAVAARQRGEELVRQLETKQAFLQTVMEQTPSGLVIAEAPSGKLILYNRMAALLLGYEYIACDDYPDNTPCIDYSSYANYGAVHADGSHYHAEEYPLARAIISGEVVEQEDTLYLRGDGRLICVAISAAPIRDATGTIVAAVAELHDVSERNELERKKDAFICIASHELRTPLTSMKGNLQLAERRLQRVLSANGQVSNSDCRTTCEELTMRIERTLYQVNVQNRLIGDLLDASRIQMEKLHLSIERCDLRKIVYNIVKDVQSLLPQRSITFDLPECDIPIMADCVRIGQVVHNYLTNALKYSEETRPVCLGIGFEEHMARVWVRDSGEGLTPEVQQQIWDRFYQASSQHIRKSFDGGGLGLGLYISRFLIQEHGGNVGVISAPGKGSTFWFTLPVTTYS